MHNWDLTLAEVDEDHDDQVNFKEFLSIFSKVSCGYGCAETQAKHGTLVCGGLKDLAKTIDVSEVGLMPGCHATGREESDQCRQALEVPKVSSKRSRRSKRRQISLRRHESLCLELKNQEIKDEQAEKKKQAEDAKRRKVL